MKVGIISDIHGNHRALEAALSYLEKQVDIIFFAGDLVGYYPFIKECLELLKTKKIIPVRGNHDQVLIDFYEHNTPIDDYQNKYGTGLLRGMSRLDKSDFQEIASWPTISIIKLESTKFYMVHGTPWDNLHGRVYPDFTDWNLFNNCKGDVILLGHTHYPLIKKLDHKLIINPGSIGQPRQTRGPHAFFSILNLSNQDVEEYSVSYNAKEIIEDIYDHDTSSHKWASYLTTEE